MDVFSKNSSAQHRRDNFRKQKIGDRPKLIARGRMTGDIDAQAAQLLNETPYLRAGRSNLLSNLGPTDYHRGVLRQEPHDLAKTNIGRRVWALRGLFRRRLRAGFAAILDAEIMREAGKKNKYGLAGFAAAAVSRDSRVVRMRDYADCTRMLMSAA